jgi:HrpA-like RNA helicase
MFALHIVRSLSSSFSLLRLPKMLLEHGESKGVPTMIMVCQPCRVAATALRNWLQLSMEIKVGLRLEDGVCLRII